MFHRLEISLATVLSLAVLNFLSQKQVFISLRSHSLCFCNFEFTTFHSTENSHRSRSFHFHYILLSKSEISLLWILSCRYKKVSEKTSIFILSYWGRSPKYRIILMFIFIVIAILRQRLRMTTKNKNISITLFMSFWI